MSYKTAFRWWKAGKLDAYQLDTGTVIVREPDSPIQAKGVALYARVSSADQKEDLERQMQRHDWSIRIEGCRGARLHWYQRWAFKRSIYSEDV
ncbi:hypothetical protein [Ktedonospora formicarum]|uniref:hypothetical protein n=1 Tax=Ktedonospora formicarum TaxID=2778364 RepID=UPI001C693675|nr:hypothetical protein [Ktedonospora formicarum]